ncbi:hypothetical protein D3C78_1039020 [compost metagenome]
MPVSVLPFSVIIVVTSTFAAAPVYLSKAAVTGLMALLLGKGMFPVIVIFFRVVLPAKSSAYTV